VNNIETWKDAAQLDAVIQQMAASLRELLDRRGIERPLMVGVHTGGVWIANRLHQLLGLGEPLGKLDISFYRDDFTRIGINPQVRPSRLPVALDGRHLILVDDVLQTGRTVRAALNELFDYGRPASVLLVVLAERGGRELPIEPDLVGLRPELAKGRQVKLAGPEPLSLIVSEVPPRARRGAGGSPTDEHQL